MNSACLHRVSEFIWSSRQNCQAFFCISLTEKKTDKKKTAFGRVNRNLCKLSNLSKLSVILSEGEFFKGEHLAEALYLCSLFTNGHLQRSFKVFKVKEMPKERWMREHVTKRPTTPYHKIQSTSCILFLFF